MPRSPLFARVASLAAVAALISLTSAHAADPKPADAKPADPKPAAPVAPKVEKPKPPPPTPAEVVAKWMPKLEAGLAEVPATPPAAPKAGRKVLIFSRTTGFRHSSIPVGAKALEMLGAKTGAYTSVHSEDPAVFEADSLKQFDAVIMLNTTGNPLSSKEPGVEDRLKKNLVDFVKGGKGLAGTHSATDTYGNWPEYVAMMGGTFNGHPWHQMVAIKNLAPDHPLNKVFAGKGLSVADEIYQFKDSTAKAEDRLMLLALADTTDEEKKVVAKGKRADNLFPISWVATYGEGRTYYCSLGHREEIYANPVVLQHYLAGFQYVLGDLPAKALATPVAGAAK